MEHQCSEKERIRQNADAIISVGGSVLTIENSVKALVDQVSRMADLFERAAVSETEIRGINKEMTAMWRRIDETLKEVRRASETDREILKTIEFMQQNFAGEIERVKKKIDKVESLAESAKSLAQELKDTPGKLVFKYAGIAVAVLITILVTRYFDRIL